MLSFVTTYREHFHKSFFEPKLITYAGEQDFKCSGVMQFPFVPLKFRKQHKKEYMEVEESKARIGLDYKCYTLKSENVLEGGHFKDVLTSMHGKNGQGLLRQR